MKLKQWMRNESRSDIKVMLLDGGVSTHLEENICTQLGFNPPFSIRSLWSSSLLLTKEGRQAIQKCHEDFLFAGSNIITSVTYQLHYGCIGNEAVMDTGKSRPILIEDVDNFLRLGVTLAKEAIKKCDREDTAFVAASIGCYGASLADGSEYRGV